MNRVTFCGGESTGSVADRKIETAKQESTGGVAVKTNSTARAESTGGVAARIYQQQEPTIKMETLQRDTVSFHGREDGSKKESAKALGAAAAICFTAAGAVVGLGYAKKQNWVGKIEDEKVRNFVTEYCAEPCYKLCHNVKEQTTNAYNRVADFFKGKKN